MLNFSSNAPLRQTSKENIPPSGKVEASQVQRPKQRTVLGVLSENKQHGRSVSKGDRFSKHSSVSDSSQHTLLGCTSSSGFDVNVEEACEVVLSASGQEVVSKSYHLDTETTPLQNIDMRLLLGLSSSPCKESSMQSEIEESLMSDEDLFVSEYAEDIHQHLRESEMTLRAKPGHLENHPEITSSMRVVLVDWMVEVVQEYNLRPETLHLAVNYLDRFLSCTALIQRAKLQLVGTVALLIASKYEEIYPPKLNDFVYITDSTYTKGQLIRMEHFVFKVLAFKMAAPTMNQFLRLFMSIHPVCANTENLALYVAELSLMEIEPFLHYTSSMVAAAAFCLALYTVNESLWPDSLSVFTAYTMADIGPCLNELHKLFIGAESHPQQAITKKYKSSKYCHVSRITPPDTLLFP
ncbi:cyclin-A1 [Hippoglossus hippoglossus]|uniref:cyclin-A1 n=1 Tax=Hippoglossus hippoglossus TaxID=8267 RepID=UPI00148B43D0|nr:cyclin-A1 [Hippoglossus hippoglossus]